MRGSPAPISPRSRVRTIRCVRPREGVRRRPECGSPCPIPGARRRVQATRGLAQELCARDPDAERDRQYASAVAGLSEQLHRGEIPGANSGTTIRAASSTRPPASGIWSYVSQSRTASFKANSKKLTLRGTLLHYYLWEQAGLNRWSPAMAGKRSW
ncbi:DNA polymerase III, gamma/tau subunit [Candidatus Burkholderia pumila]|uniref:DNA polymerase III, gamma/tau subunit n=1 Tax=Candidatus Burkholderia pumila TaxID=1090375 RepID=A0ABR5HPI7_9BURK|nr:DNA polymerase III, gamma/tau subunit [Candidatus Burkholderia pumila]